MDVLGKRIENPVDYQSKGTKLISVYHRGTYEGTRVRYDRGTCADVRATYRRLLRESEQGKHRVASIGQRVLDSDVYREYREYQQ